MHIKTLKIMKSVLCVCVCLSMVILTMHDFCLHFFMRMRRHTRKHTCTCTHTHTHTQQQQQQQQQQHTNTHSWFVVFSHVPHFLHTHTVWHVFFSIFPCCRTPLRAVKKCTRWIRKALDKVSQASFQSGSYSSYAEPKTADDKTTGCVWNV